VVCVGKDKPGLESKRGEQTVETALSKGHIDMVFSAAVLKWNIFF
jgi:hypothetical protein